jgi:acyl phosphate:glycerol-3-phosphate acyltransferase
MAESIYFKIFYVIASYLLGSVVFGYIIAKILKKEGFGKIDRPGTAGAGRLYGFKAALPTFVFDCGKGAMIPLVGRAIGLDTLTIVIASLSVLVGHNWPVFFKFRGGGGVATTMGISAVLIPIQFLIVLISALSISFIYKYTLRKKHNVNPNVIGSLFAVIVLPILVYFWPFLLNEPFLLFMLTIGIFVIIVVKGIILHMIYRKIPTAG